MDLLTQNFQGHILSSYPYNAFQALKQWHRKSILIKTNQRKSESKIKEMVFGKWRIIVKFAHHLNIVFRNREFQSMEFSFFTMKRFYFINERLYQLKTSKNQLLCEKYFYLLKEATSELKKNQTHRENTLGLLIYSDV